MIACTQKNKKVRWLICVLATVAMLFAFKYLANLFFPFIIGFLFSALIRKCVQFVEKVTGMNLKISAVICTALAYTLIFALLFVVARALISEVIRLIDNLPNIYEKNILPLIQGFELRLSNASGKHSEFEKMLMSVLNNAESEIAGVIKTFSADAAEKIGDFLLKIPEFFVTVTVTIVASFFISADYDNIKKFFISHVGSDSKRKASKIKGALFESIGKLCVAYFIIFVITFAQLATGLYLLKVKYAFALSLVIAIADIFPIIGTGTILIPWSIIEVFNGNKPLALGLVALFLIISIVRNIIEPKLIGKNSGIHPVATMIAIYVGLKTGGFLYAILCPFLLIIIKQLKEKEVL